MDEYEGDAYAELGVKKDATEKEIKVSSLHWVLQTENNRQQASGAAKGAFLLRIYSSLTLLRFILLDCLPQIGSQAPPR